MSTDPERTDEPAEPRPTAPRRVGLPQDADRRSRSLGRGFEDIADTFLARKPVEPPEEIDRPAPAERTTRETDGPLLVRAGLRVSKEQLITTLKNFPQEVEPGLRVIDNALPCGSAGEIDLLAVDRGTRLVIVNVSADSDANLLLPSLAQAEWIARNIAVVRRMYAGQLIDFSQEPRICLIAPRFSSVMEAAVRRVTAKVMCLAFRDLELPGRLGISLERAGASD